MTSSKVRFTVWGGVAASCGGQVLNLGGPVQRSLLAALLVQPNRWVAVPVLFSWVWADEGDDADDPEPVKTRLQVAVHRLNRALPESHRVEHDKDRNAYRLEVADDDVDVLQFERWGREAEARLAAGQPESARSFAGLALELCTGEPFGDLASRRFLGSRVDELQSRRRVIEGVHVEALLATGHPEDAVSVAERLRGEEPAKQGWCELLALALYGSGRTNDAVAEIARYRDELVEIGLIERDQLNQLERNILDNSPAVAWVVPSAPRALLGKDRPTGPKTLLLARLEPAPPAGEGAEVGLVAQGYYRAEVAAAVSAHHGFLFDGSGLRLGAVFERPIDAVTAAGAATTTLVELEKETGLSLRPAIAVHTGMGDIADGSLVAKRDSGYAGDLREAAHPGQIVVSETTRRFALDYLEPDVGLAYVASWQPPERRAERVYHLTHPSLPAGFPPLRGLSSSAGAPHYRTSFVGREHQIADIARRLGPGSLVTIVGTGGIGKTRLADEVTKRPPFAKEPPYDDGRVEVRFCDVSLAENRTALHERIARGLGFGHPAGSDIREVLTEALSTWPVLLVLDSCERRREDVAELLDDVMHTGFAGRVLATSQAALDVPGEQVVTLDPLSLETGDGEDVAPAVLLLVERAQQAGATTGAEDPAVVELARRLGGLPLAIELVARHLRSASAGEVLAHLDDYVSDASGPQSLPARQRTLRATFTWSADLLKAAPRRLLAGLSVLDGPWSLDAAEAVAPAVDVDPDQVLRLVAELVDLSIVEAATPPKGPARYRIFDTIRTFAAEHLDELERRTAAADLHAGHFTDLAERATRHRWGPDEAAWTGAVFAELDNVRAARRHLIDHQRWDEAARLVVALDELMVGRMEVGQWAVELCRTGEVTSHLHAVQGIAATAYMNQGRLEEALELARTALATDAASGLPERAWRARNVMAMAGLAHHAPQGRSFDWGVHLRALEHISDTSAKPFPRALALWNRVFLAGLTERYDLAGAPARKLLDLADRHDNPSMRAMGLVACGRVARSTGDTARARDLFQQALGAAEAVHNNLMVDLARQDLAHLANGGDGDGVVDHRAALKALVPVARSHILTGNVSQQTQTAVHMAKHLAEIGNLVPAARALARMDQTPMAKTKGFSDEVRAVLDRLDEDDRATALREGAATPLPRVLPDLLQVVDEVLQQEDPT
jgi:predicted ATPase/DNA-binding SARP family transcriptional activator